MPKRHNASEALVEIGLPAVESLITALQDDAEIVREYAAEVLGKIGDHRAVEPLLLAALKDGDRYVREEAAEALWKMKDPRAIEALNATQQDKQTVIYSL